MAAGRPSSQMLEANRGLLFRQSRCVFKVFGCFFFLPVLIAPGSGTLLRAFPASRADKILQRKVTLADSHGLSRQLRT